jgi:hypothetical protein
VFAFLSPFFLISAILSYKLSKVIMDVKNQFHFYIVSNQAIEKQEAERKRRQAAGQKASRPKKD